VPRKLARVVAKTAGVRFVEPPCELKSFPYFMAWHQRLSNEPVHSWFREQFRLASQAL
jgi:DNA-binding transcriptional LysR family regulator